MTIERNKINGSYLIYTFDNQGNRIKQIYYGYTKKEAKDLFLKHLAHLIVDELQARN